MHLCVPVTERKTAGAVMVKSRQVLPELVGAGGVRGKTSHVSPEITPVDDIFPLVQEQKSLNRLRRARVVQVGYFEEEFHAEAKTSVLAIKTAQVQVHRNGANAGLLLAVDQHIRMIGAALVNAGIPVVGPERAKRNVGSGIPVLWIG